MIECLNNIIGVVKEPCDCTEIPNGIELSKSKTGLFLESGGSFNDVFQALRIASCNGDSIKIWNRILQIVEDAKNKTISDISLKLQDSKITGYNLNGNRYSGKIGDKMATNKAINSADWSIVGVKTDLGGNNLVEVSKVGLGVFQTGISYSPVSVEKYLFVWDENGTPITHYKDGIETLEIIINTSTTKNKWYEFDEPIKGKQLFFGYENEGYYYNDNDVWCGCGGKETKPSYLDYLSFDAISANSVEDFSLIKNLYNTDIRRPLLNMRFELSAYCDLSNIICQNLTPAMRHKIGEMVVYEASKNLAYAIINSTEIGFRRLVDWEQERMIGVFEHNEAEYNKVLKEIAPLFNVTSSGCYDCKRNQLGISRAMVRK